MNQRPGHCILFFTASILAGFLSRSAGAQTKDSRIIRDLRSRFPGVQVRMADDGATTIFGRRMTTAATPDKAAALFLDEFRDAFGVPDPELRLEWQADLGSGKGTVFAYRQFIDGLPVEHGIARVFVSVQSRNAVIYAAGRLTAPRGFEPGQVSGESARTRMRSLPDHAQLSRWSEPELVIYAGEREIGSRTPMRAWKITATTDRADEPHAVSFYVNAATGRLLFARNEIYHGVPISGHVSGLATPGVLPDNASNPPLQTPLADLFLTLDLENIGTTNSDGNFSIDGDGSEIALSARLVGPFAEVRDTGSQPPLLTQSVAPPGPADFLFNVSPTESTTAQVNAFLYTNRTREFYTRYQPDFLELDRVVTANVNMTTLSCNAFFTPIGLSINFFAADDRCVNTAFSSVIIHEYGHFIVNQLRLAQGSFGEGFADTVAILMQDDPIVGHDFFGPGTFVRDTVGANEQYPCRSENHVCGQVLAGIWWDIKENLQSSLGNEQGLETARQLFTDWSLITLGGRFKNSAHPGTPSEVLTTDDDDGDLANGTPHFEEICSAFAAHGISCSNVADCDSLRMRVSCRRGTVSAVVHTAPNASMTVVLDGAIRQISTSDTGRALVRFHNVSGGDHEICIAGCEESCRTVTCN